MSSDPKYRPPVEERWTDGMRTTPVRIGVRTEWLYSEPDPKVIVPPGRTRHAFSTSGHVTHTDVPTPYEHMQDIVSHVHRAVRQFGDDKDLIIEVRLADSEISTVAQLQDVPIGTIVRSAAGTIASRFDQDNGVVFGDDRPFPWEMLQLPVTVVLTADAARG
ncbi:hypothetical protein [uncultured Microbacterium sp.]|uniref:hypothetical protein n=1 Tax=uncultured Microbacterium sp. TaxID=191216 RepID=UPI002602D323|nr:hypothetical protein [uncultured Microbacterium sp.]